MDRRVILVGAAVLFGVWLLLGFLLGFLLGRSANDEEIAAPTSPANPTTTTTQPAVVVTPLPGEAPAISSDGQVLQESDRVVPTDLPATDDRVRGLVLPGGGFGDGGRHCGPAIAAVTG